MICKFQKIFEISCILRDISYRNKNIISIHIKKKDKTFGQPIKSVTFVLYKIGESKIGLPVLLKKVQINN